MDSAPILDQDGATNQSGDDIDVFPSIAIEPSSQSTPLTFMNYDWYKFSPKTLFSICPCLKWSPEDEAFGLPPVNATDIPSTPLLTGDQAVSSIEELRQIVDQLLTKPIFTKVTYSYETEHMYRTDTIVVVIDTSHPAIYESLKSCLDVAVKRMEEGINFYVEFNFAKSLKECIAVLFRPGNHRFGQGCRLSDDAKFCLTNFSKPIKFLTDPCFIGLCFVCWIFIGPCYIMYRKQLNAVTDFETICPEVNATYIMGTRVVKYIRTDHRRNS